MYELFYGLNSRPFRMSPDLEFFCLTQSHKRALVHLRYGLQQAEGFVLLSGLPGTGKTLITQVIMKELQQQNVQVASISHALTEESDLLPALLSAFDKPIFEYKLRALVSQLEAFLLSKAESGQRAVIVIDEAQNLSQRSLEILRLLSNLQHKNHAILQVVLVGDTTLEGNLSNQENHLLRQRVVLSYQLNSMQFEDTQNYILHRLKCAGWKNNPEFHQDVFFVIQHLSKGVPSEINRFFDRLLMQSMLRKKHQITTDDVDHLLIDDINYAIPEAITYEPKARKTILDTVIEQHNIDTQTLSNNVKQEKLLDNSFLKEPEKQIDSSDEIHEVIFNLTPDKNYSSTFSTLLLSYAASLLLAILLFYAGSFIAIDGADVTIDNNLPTHTIHREITSFAETD